MEKRNSSTKLRLNMPLRASSTPSNRAKLEISSLVKCVADQANFRLLINVLSIPNVIGALAVIYSPFNVLRGAPAGFRGFFQDAWVVLLYAEIMTVSARVLLYFAL